jgi:Mg-chelatase subunit ChlI
MALKRKSRRDDDSDPIINFSGVESGGRRCPDGEYAAVIASAELEKSSNDKPMAALQWKITEGKFKGVKLYDNVSLVPQAFWKMKSLLEAVGIEPQEEDVRASEYIKELPDMEATIVVTNETFEGEQRPKVTGYGANGEAEEEPRVRNKRKAKGEEDASETEDDGETEDDEEDSGEDEDDEAAQEEDEESEDEPKKKGKAGKPVAKRKARVKEGSRVKFDDGEGHVIKGTVTSLDDGKATVEDKNGDEYEIDAEDVELI